MMYCSQSGKQFGYSSMTKTKKYKKTSTVTIKNVMVQMKKDPVLYCTTFISHSSQCLCDAMVIIIYCSQKNTEFPYNLVFLHLKGPFFRMLIS